MNHKTVLESLCRVCGNKIKSKTGYVNAKPCTAYSDTLFRCYGIDVENESLEIYPKYLCGGCKRKLDDLKKDSTKEVKHGGQQ